MISVVMSVYNEELSMVVKAVDSMLNQTYQGEIEIIIVVDNPDNKEIVEILSDYENRFSSIRVLINKINRGLPYSLNRAIEHANGDYICRMDADDISFPTRIEREIEYLQANNLDFVSSTAIPINDNDQVLGEKILVPLTHTDISRVIRYTGCLIHPTWFFTKSSWFEIGGYREAMVAAQDYDYSIRMINHGCRVGTIETPLLYYRIRNNAISVSKRALQTFLGLYAQNNVYRNGEFDNSINVKIESGSCREYNDFVKAFNTFFDAQNTFSKSFKILAGCFKSKFFFRFVYNTLMLRITRIF